MAASLGRAAAGNVGPGRAGGAAGPVRGGGPQGARSGLALPPRGAGHCRSALGPGGPAGRERAAPACAAVRVRARGSP